MEDPKKNRICNKKKKKKRRSTPTRKRKARVVSEDEYKEEEEQEEEEESEDDNNNNNKVVSTSQACSAIAAATAEAQGSYLDKLKEWRKAGVLYARSSLKEGCNKPSFRGLGKAKLYKVPYVLAWLKEKSTKDIASAPPEVQHQLEEDQRNPDGPKLVNTKDLNKGRNDMTSALGNFFGFWLRFKGYSPKPELIYTESRVKEYILWLQAYYLPGSTTRNKCWHLKNYVAFLRLAKDDATQEQVRRMIICKKLFNKAANESKQVARADRVLLEDEHHMTHVKNKFMTKEEGIAFFHWCLTRWLELYLLFLPEDDSDNDDEDEEEERDTGLHATAFRLQRVMIGMMLYLGGGLRKQVFVDLYAKNLKWDSNEMVMRVGREKVARVNTSIMPLPIQLFTYIEFYKQRIRPHLIIDPDNPPLSMWLNHKGIPINSNKFTDYVKDLFFDFNPELDTTPIDFRRMTVTDLFAERLVMEEGETMEHFHARFSEYLNVSVPVMKAHYNRHRAREHNRQTLKTINADKVSPAATTLMQQMEARMVGAVDQSAKDPLYLTPKRKVRDTPDDEAWEAQSGYSPSPQGSWRSKRKAALVAAGRLTRRRKLNFHKKDAEEEEAEAEEELDSADIDDQLDDLDEEWEVQAIQGMRAAQEDHKTLEVLVKWKGYTTTTWEPLSEMANSLEALQAYLLKTYSI